MKRRADDVGEPFCLLRCPQCQKEVRGEVWGKSIGVWVNALYDFREAHKKCATTAVLSTRIGPLGRPALRR